MVEALVTKHTVNTTKEGKDNAVTRWSASVTN